MKLVVYTLFFLISSQLFAQIPCEYSQNIKDSIGTYKSTKEQLIYEKNFAGNKNYIFFTLVSTDGMPTLNINFIQKSKDFMKAKCFDKNSKLYLQLNNGKVVSLIHTNSETCGTMLRDNEGYDNRILTANFMFLKGSIEDLKNSPVNLMRIKYLTDVEDYVIKKEFQSEFDNTIYQPESFFINYLHCVENN